MRKRILFTIASVLVLLGASVPVANAATRHADIDRPGVVVSTPTSKPDPTPSSTTTGITCYTEADKPYVGRDGKLYGWGLFWCSGVPWDVYMTVQLQRFDPVKGIWINQGAPQTDITPFVGTFRMPDVLACAAGAPSRLYRTRTYMRAWYLNWDEDYHESATMRAYC